MMGKNRIQASSMHGTRGLQVLIRFSDEEILVGKLVLKNRQI